MILFDRELGTAQHWTSTHCNLSYRQKERLLVLQNIYSINNGSIHFY